MSYRNRKRKAIAEINVVPYIDVMLVLLIIFMVTAPLLTEGVKIDLPQTTESAPIDANPDAPEPFVLTVDAQGKLFIDDREYDASGILRYATVLYQEKPATDFLVRGDKNARYEFIMQAMVLLKEAGIETVSLVTEPLADTAK
ncbi:protein TolR [Arenicella sp. 4NH20-0111]|uniref:ExbD/TolR family protein n=1 Tax=Arenicella sp. 4NH20-0111 TaxID=3127648 RepID=UPI00310601CF